MLSDKQIGGYAMSYHVKYGPADHRQRFDGKLAEIWPAYQRLEAEGHENVQIISPDGEVADPQQFRLDTQDGPQALGEG